jgi:hypothetical protein
MRQGAMNNIYYTPSVFETFNARHLTADQVARTFVPPVEIFADLATRNHHILLGPRGSGKTTLLKMLTLPALATWDVAAAEIAIPKVDFIGIFIPADRGWQVQLQNAGAHRSEPVSVGRIAFTTHVLASLIQTLRDMLPISERSGGPLIERLPAFDQAVEAKLVEEIAPVWRLKPSIKTLGGLSIALRARLVQLGSMRERARRSADPEGYLLDNLPHADLAFRDCVSHAIEVYGVLTGDQPRSWSFLFDEFEVAPSHIQKEILASLRGESDTRILYKIALAPYNENFMQNVSDISASPGNDFRVIDLWFPEKARAYNFSERLVRKVLAEEGVVTDRLTRVFGRSEFGFPEPNDVQPYEEDGRVLESFKSLAEIDPSFRRHLGEKEIRLDSIGAMSESERAEKIRKIRSVVITREYFLRSNKDSKSSSSVRGRSRKIQRLYTGYPTLVALAEGNPRLLIGIMTPLVRTWCRWRSGARRIDKSAQAAQIKRAANSFRALLKTIPYGEDGDADQRGLLRLLDDVGDYFHRKSVLEAFTPQPPLSFIVDSTTDDATLKAVGRALNAGAIVYVPDLGADPILTSLRGKRFRMCYLLAAYYKLPIMLNTGVALSSIIGRRARRGPRLDGRSQSELFSGEKGSA